MYTYVISNSDLTIPIRSKFLLKSHRKEEYWRTNITRTDKKRGYPLLMNGKDITGTFKSRNTDCRYDWPHKGLYQSEEVTCRHSSWYSMYKSNRGGVGKLPFSSPPDLHSVLSTSSIFLLTDKDLHEVETSLHLNVLVIYKETSSLIIRKGVTSLFILFQECWSIHIIQKLLDISSDANLSTDPDISIFLPSCFITCGRGVSTSFFIFSFIRGILPSAGCSCKNRHTIRYPPSFPDPVQKTVHFTPRTYRDR